MGALSAGVSAKANFFKGVDGVDEDGGVWEEDQDGLVQVEVAADDGVEDDMVLNAERHHFLNILPEEDASLFVA